MQYRTNYFALFFIASITGILIYFISNASYFSFSEPVFLSMNNFKIYKDENNKFSVLIPKSTKIILNEEGIVNFQVNKTYVGKNIEEEIRRGYFTTTILYLKDKNSKEMPIDDWYQVNNLENEKSAPVSDLQEKISINGIGAYKVTYGRAKEQLSSFYYNVIYIYIPHGTDIYEVHGFKLPDNPSSDLTPEDIQAAKEYEKIFDQILQSIEFLD